MKLKAAENGAASFLGMLASIEQVDVIIVPFGLEKTVCFEKGTRHGPRRMIEVSPQLPFFDDELERKICDVVKIATLEEPVIVESHEAAIGQLEGIVDEIYSVNKFPLILGGEHSLTLGPVRSAFRNYGPFSILQFDAHDDLSPAFDGNIYSHASVMRQCLKLPGVKLTQVGLRSISSSSDEYAFLAASQGDGRIRTFWAKNNTTKWNINGIVNSLYENVYLTFDLDAFDSSLMPATGTPEPGGLFWWQALEILRAVFGAKNIIGADVVELCPRPGLHAADIVAAKLVYKIIGYKFLL